MADQSQVAKLLKDAMKSGKYLIGSREVRSGMKGAKAIICTKSVPPKLESRLRSEAKNLGIPVIQLPATSAEFARMIGRPYRVSTMALRAIGESELKQLQR